MKYDNLLYELAKSPMPEDKFLVCITDAIELHGIFIPDVRINLELLKLKGFPLAEIDNQIVLSTTRTDWKQQCFCFVDIETTGSKPEFSSMIEIGALKYQNGKIIDKFESFVYTQEVPESIVELTGICANDIKDSPTSIEVLRDFRLFLDDSVFVAHNVNFDYDFISYHMSEAGFGEICNPRLCTIELAHRTILSPRYSLVFLNTFLGINTPVSHRAYADAFTALRVFEIALECLPKNVKTTQDLIDFSKKKF